jgi:signal transduction histidine kinase
MRERLRVHGGELEAGPLPGGGFQVRARLPLERERAGVP